MDFTEEKKDINSLLDTIGAEEKLKKPEDEFAGMDLDDDGWGNDIKMDDDILKNMGGSANAGPGAEEDGSGIN
jgi:hypothetical protein